MKMDMMHYEKIPVDEIIPNPNNPRVPLDPSMPVYQDLKRSILKFKYIDPIVWNRTTGYIISGHQRFQILQDIAKEKGEELTEINCIVVEMDEQHQNAFMLTVNKLSGIWDEGKLMELFEGMDKDDWQYTGYTEYEIKDLMNESMDIDDGEPITDTELPTVVRPQVYSIDITYDTKEEREWIFQKLGMKGKGDRYEVSQLIKDNGTNTDTDAL